MVQTGIVELKVSPFYLAGADMIRSFEPSMEKDEEEEIWMVNRTGAPALIRSQLVPEKEWGSRPRLSALNIHFIEEIEMEQPELESQMHALFTKYLKEGGTISDIIDAFNVIQEELED